MTPQAGDVPPPYSRPMSTSRSARRQLRIARRALTTQEQRKHAQQLSRHLGRSLRFRRAKRIGIYWPTDGELDPRPLLRLKPSSQWHLPVLRRFPRPKLMFVRWSRRDRLAPNRFGIPEPRRRGLRVRSPLALDLLLVPAVGLDRRGHRIGMGCGYYDRTLAFLLRRRYWRRPRLVGIAHSCQELPAIVPQPWDVPLDAIVTDEGLWGKV